ncbi:ceramide phosphoethanolamine synthase-like [Tachypleus tridentatus]|uniref:ceramide phosphoethanolamine synthase-like n=1 Tax=Tachypleus tridentatus TaxID=6853 RepID=UPI003FCF06C5
MSACHIVFKQGWVFICVSGLMTYFLWMDISLYINVQRVPTLLKKPKSEQPTNINSSRLSPFMGLSVKMMMMDPINNYIVTPTAQLFNYVTSFSETCNIITPNMISLIGLMFAVVAAKCIISDNLTRHRIAVLLFEIRTWCDALDGIVARSRMGMVKHVSLRSTSGYVVDGLIDTLGFTTFLIGCLFHIRRRPPKRVSSCKDYVQKNGVYNESLTNCTDSLFCLVFCFGMQVGLSAFLWDRYIHNYSELLETPQSTIGKAIAQNEQLKSAFNWIIMWFWRVSNAHCLIHFLLIAIIIDKMWEFLRLVQYAGFVELLALALFSELNFHRVSIVCLTSVF